MFNLQCKQLIYLAFLSLFFFPLPSLAADDIDSSANIIGASFNIRVEESTGSFKYSYPLTFPNGRNGLNPIIGLGYNSNNRANNNVAGLGWTLGLSYIERKNLHGSDNLYSRHDFFSSLSGDLEEITFTSGSYGTYGAKIDDGSFLSYEYGDDESWTIIDKKGVTYVFGSSTASQVVNPDDSTQVFRWLLDEVTDLNGNKVTYSYIKDSNQVYLSEINYTGHESESGIYDVLFTYEFRSDVFTSYASGFEIQTAKRLQQIDIEVSESIVRTYELTYETGDNDVRSLLSSITETGYGEDESSLTKPPTTFDYSEAERSWTEDTSYAGMPFEIAGSGVGSLGVYLFDVNSDGFFDIVKARNSESRKVYINNGDNTWTEDTSISVPFDFANSLGKDEGVRVFDLNGDGFQDLVKSKLEASPEVYINNGDGTGWSLNTSVSVPVVFTIYGNDSGVRVFDVNGDGLQDIVSSRYGYSSYVYINDGDGTGWTLDEGYSVPITFTNGSGFDNAVNFFDVNGDNLVDLVYSHNNSGTIDDAVYINNGDGTGWTEDVSISVPVGFVLSSLKETGTRCLDFNGDGLIDLVSSQIGSLIEDAVYINNGDGTGWTLDSTSAVPIFFTNAAGQDLGVRQVDINNDGLDDIIYSRNDSGAYHELYVADGSLSDQLSEIGNDHGGTTTIMYEPVTEVSGKMFFPLSTVSSVTTDDGLGNTSTTSYEYYDGDYYYASEEDRDFAGFGYVETTNGLGEMTRTYYHQGNDTESTLGESTDDRSKLWRSYREEIYDSSDHLYRTTIHSWENEDLGNDRDFIYEGQTLELLYDADTDHTDKATNYSFDFDTGNLISKIDYAEVTGNDDGTFSDVGAIDNLTTQYTYAEFSGDNLSSYPSTEEVLNGVIARVTFSAWNYDNLSAGVVSLGNLTHEAHWIASGVYADTYYTYDDYGFKLSETDPVGNETNFTPDSNEIFVAVVTNALDQTVSYEYDYSSGKVTQKTEANGYVFTTDYDAFDRPVLEAQPNAVTPTTLEAKTAWSYDDTLTPTIIHQTDYFDVSTTRETFIFYDGFGRAIQTRQENADGFVVSDIIYDELGRKENISLPYQGSGEDYTEPTTTTALLETLTYDVLGRVVSDENIEGVVTTVYEAWSVASTDRNDNTKIFLYDAFGRLVRVNERPGTSAFLTFYLWDAGGRLVKITDADSKIRYFGYDGLGRRLTAEDLRATADTQFGSWTYAYDYFGNLTSSVSPNSITTSYTYDDLNRILTEDADSATGTEIVYVYDTCTNGVGRLCSATVNGGAITEYEYDALGRVSEETKTINSVEYVTGYEYDRQGNITSVIYPNDSYTNYFINTSGQVETVEFYDALTNETATIADNITYSPNGKIESLLYGNSVTSTYTFNENDLYRLISTITVSASDNIEDYEYTYDPVGNLTDLSDTSTLLPASMSITYSYDDQNRLIEAESTSTESSLTYDKTWNYNPTGNITSSSENGTYLYQSSLPNNYANPHAVTALAGKTIIYDHNGNILNDGTWLNTWNWRNNLTQSHKTNTTVVYTYDHNNTRVTEDSTTGQDLTYPNDYYALDSTNQKRHILLPGFGSLATSTYDTNEETSSIVYHHRDHLGGTHIETDDTGTPIEYIVYNPFGSVLSDVQTTGYENNLKFTGKELDEDTGWYYYGARYYSSDRSRFMSQDPISRDTPEQFLSDPQQLNYYSYSRDNPLRFVDPLGLFNTETGEIEKGDSSDSITNSINKTFGINTDWETIQNVSFYNDRFGDKTLEQLAGQNLLIGTSVTTDITKQLNSLNQARSIFAGLFGIGSLGLFAPNFPWDIKNSTDLILGGGRDNREYTSYIYNGQLIRYDAPGNINYGYVAHSLGLNSIIIQSGARLEQVSSNLFSGKEFSLSDSKGDSQYIQMGISAESSSRSWW